MIEEKERDPLRELFAQRPEADLPDGFAARTMERIYREAQLAGARGRRWERIGMALLFALPIVTLIVVTQVLKVALPWPDLHITWPDLAACRFYFQIGALVFLLWTVDALFRRIRR